MAVVIMGLGALAGIGSLVCWIIVEINIFKDNVLMGVLGICGLVSFIYGWNKASEYGIEKVMKIWTVCFIASIVLQIAGRALGVGQ